MDSVQVNLASKAEACYFTMDAGPNVKVPLSRGKTGALLSEIFGQRYRL